MRKTQVALCFGGQSEEHEVSIMTAREIMRAIDKEKYDLILFGIDRAGYWQCVNDIPESLKTLSFDHAGPKIPDDVMVRLQSEADVAFPLLHGPYGEDGRIQGMFDMIGLPYAGCDMVSSALCMDKDIAKKLLARIGIPVTPSVTLLQGASADVDAIVRELGLPLFVKPVNLGSSVGISKVKQTADLSSAVHEAFRYDRKVIIEKGIHAREIECAVMGTDDPVVSYPGEIIPSHEFYDYEAKYFDEGRSKLIIPADLPGETAEKIRSHARKAFLELGCSGLARVDFFVDKDSGEIYLNELNTMPGFTPFSMYPQLMAHSGVAYSDLIDRLIQYGLKG